MLAESVNAPFAVVTVIITVPGFSPVTKPLLSTVAIELFSEDQDTLVLVALFGVMVAVNCIVSSGTIVAVFGFTVTPVTGIGSQLVPYAITGHSVEEAIATSSKKQARSC